MSTTVNAWPSKDGLKIGHLNINHAINKQTDIMSILSNSGNNFHIFCFSESRLSDQISDTDMSVSGYNIIRRDPKFQKETGLLVYINNSIKVKRISMLEKDFIESIWIEVNLKRTKPILVGFIYRNPAEPVDWMDKFTSLMEDVCNESREIILMGDFNIDLLKPSKRWIHTYESFHLTQLIKIPTRQTATSKTLIDHVYVSNKHNIVESCVPMYGISDHFPTCVTWSKKGVKVPRNSHKTINYRCFSNFNADIFLLDLMNSSLSDVYQYTDPNEAFEVWCNNFLNIYNKHAPFKTKRVRHVAKVPWITREIYDEINLRDHLLKSGHNEEYKKQRNKVTSLKRAAKKKYFQDLVTSKKDCKSIWKAINQLTNKNTDTNSTLVKDISAISLNMHFCNIADNIIKTDKSKTNNLNTLEDFCRKTEIKSTPKIPFMSIHEVYNALLQSKQTGTRGLDGIDGKILKLSAPIITETLTYIYNLCIDKNCFPDAFKRAKVIPLYKSGNRDDPSNYRPISILSVLSKPLEKHLNKCILSHFKLNNLLLPNQSGFRQNHSCHTALINLVDSWLSNINNNEFTGVLFVDFAKAFDVIDHDLLVRKLAVYGLSDNTLQLISSFLSNRQQAVAVNATVSELFPVKYGVPQGSVLGPLLFSIYINDLPLFIQAVCDLFADDTTIHKSHSNPQYISHKLQETINNLVEWTELNHMALNPQKTKFMLVTTRQKRQNLTDSLPPLYVKDKKIEEVESHKVLGLTIDNNLSWSNHIMLLCKNIAKKVYQLSRIKHFLDIQARRQFFYAYIQSNIDYASTVWDSVSANVLKPLISLHKRALKLVLLKPSSLSASDYIDLDILPLKPKLMYNKGVLMHRILAGSAPPALTAKFTFNNARHFHKIMVPLPRIDLFKSSLMYSGGFLWNNLPSTLKNQSNRNVFKKIYHGHLMSKTYV